MGSKGLRAADVPLSTSKHVCATVKRRCLGMLLFRSILRRSLGEFLGEITGESLGEADFLAVLDFSCCNRFSRRDFTRSSLSHGFGTCGLSTSGTVRVSGLVVCWAIFLVNFVQLATIQDNVVAWPVSSESLDPSLRKMSWETGRIQLLLVHSAPASVSRCRRLGVDQASALPRRSLFNVTLLPQPQPKITDELWRLRNMEGSHRASLAFVSPAKQPVKLLELMRRSCSSDFCLCT